LPDYGHKITVDHLLTHTSGIRDWQPLLNLAGGDPDAMTMILRQRELNFAPGEEWSYSNSGYVLLPEIVARVIGMPFSEFARKRLFEQLCMKMTTYVDDPLNLIKNRALAYKKEASGWKMDMYLSKDRTGARAIGADGPPSASENTQLDASSHSHNCRRYYARAGNAPKSHRQARPKLGTAPAIRSSVALASTSASGPRSRKNAAWVRWVPGQTHRFPTFSTFCSVMSTPASIVNVAEPVGQRRQFSSFFRSDRLIVSTALAHYHAWRSFQ